MMKEVYYDIYCPSCVNKDLPEVEDPCNECLTNPCNEDSHKPVRYKEKDAEDGTGKAIVKTIQGGIAKIITLPLTHKN